MRGPVGGEALLVAVKAPLGHELTMQAIEAQFASRLGQGCVETGEAEATALLQRDRERPGGPLGLPCGTQFAETPRGKPSASSWAPRRAGSSSGSR